MSARVLSPREEAILMLADGDSPPTVAQVLQTTASAVREVARAYGHPQGRTQIKAVARRLRAGDLEGGKHAGALPGCEWPPTAAAARVEGQPGTAEATTPLEVDVDDLAAAVREAGVVADQAAVLDALTAPAPGDRLDVDAVLLGLLDDPDAAQPTGPDGAGEVTGFAADTAVLAMPLGRMVDVDGRVTVLGVAEIEVRINPAGVLEALAGQLFMGREGGHLVVPVRIERRLTPEGEALIRQYAAMLPPDGDR